MAFRGISRQHPLLLVLSVSLLSTLVIYLMGAYDKTSVGVVAMVSDVLTTGRIAEMASSPHVPRLLGLLLSFFTRALLTLLCTNIPIPAGIFMPVFLIGGLLGRFVGLSLQLSLGGPGTVLGGDIDLPGYALVGACAFAAGVTHTISVSVIAVELTGNIHMLLPCLLVSVISAGITKAKGLSVYDQGMINKGLESFQLLLMEFEQYNVAQDIMDKNISMITVNCSLSQLTKLMATTVGKQELFPVVDRFDSKHIVGVISRSNLFVFISEKLTQVGVQKKLLKKVLPIDYLERETRNKHALAKINSDDKKKKFVMSVGAICAALSFPFT